MSATTMNDPMPRLLPVSWALERLPVVVLILCVAFLQGYALAFWDGLLGRAGWGVSVGLEVLHLWFWYRAAMSARLVRAGWVALATAATALLLAGALHEVTRPLLRDAAEAQAAGQVQQALRNEAQVLQSNLEAFREMAAGQERRGWQEDIRRDTAQLQAINQQLRVFGAQSGGAALRPWLNQLTQLGVIAVAVLFQVAAVLAIWSLSTGPQRAVRSVSPPVTAPTVRETKSDCISVGASAGSETFRAPTQDPYRPLWRAVEVYARGNTARLAHGNGKVSQAALARDLGINPPDLSAIKLLAQGQPVPRNPAREAVDRLAKRFGIEMPKQQAR